MFIQIDCDTAQMTPAMRLRLAQICPVDIFELDEGRLTVRADREDECTLCGLCLKAAPAGMLRIHKLYSGETLVSSGDQDADHHALNR